MSTLKLETIQHPDAVSAALTLGSSGSVSAINLAAGLIDSNAIADGSVTASKLASTLDLSSKNLTLPATNEGRGFSAYPANGQTFSSATNTKINFANEEYDDFGSYNASTSTFTVPYTGTYLVNVSLRTNPGSSHARTEVAIYINGSLYRCMGINQQNLNDMQVDVSRIMKFTEAQAVTVYLNQNSGATVTANNSSNFGPDGQGGQGHFQITLLRQS